jgi:hypothetical protein
MAQVVEHLLNKYSNPNIAENQPTNQQNKQKIQAEMKTSKNRKPRTIAVKSLLYN